MKKVLIALAVFIFAAGSFGCATNANTSADTTNLNSTNSNANATTAIVVETSNASAQPPLPEEVPTFTDANEALEAGKKYFENNRDEQAVNAFEQAVKLDPNLGEAHFHLGVAYELREENEVNPTPEPTPTGKSASGAYRSGDRKPTLSPAASAYLWSRSRNSHAPAESSPFHGSQPRYLGRWQCCRRL